MKLDLASISAVVFVALVAGATVSSVYSEDKSNSPYIDQIREGLRERDAGKPPASSESYTDTIKKKLEKEKGNEIPSNESYTEQIKKNLDVKPADGSFTEKEKTRLGPGDTSSAIEAVREGHSELHAKRKGDIHNAAGIRIGASLTRDITSATSLRPFNSVYGSNYAPDVSLFYEYQPWHSEWFGNIGIFGEVSVGYFHGAGVFQFALSKPAALGGGSFGTTSNTTFQFFSLPIIAGLDYRFNLFRYIRPFVKAGPTVVGYYEGRDDGQDGHQGNSRGVYFSGGASILMDWISGDSMTDLYNEHGIKHYYLSVDYSRLSTFSGDVTFTVSGVYAGLTFEF